MPQNKIPVAVQLYSLREVAPKDVPGTLKRVAAMGYEGVEFDGYYNLDGASLRQLLDENKLRCAGAQLAPLKLFRQALRTGEYEVVQPQNVKISHPYENRQFNWLDAIYASSATGKEVRLR